MHLHMNIKQAVQKFRQLVVDRVKSVNPEACR